jgi:hypothetical protein
LLDIKDLPANIPIWRTLHMLGNVRTLYMEECRLQNIFENYALCTEKKIFYNKRKIPFEEKFSMDSAMLVLIP